MRRVVVLGTGIMGAGMARSLLRSGLDVTVWNRSPARAAPLAADGAQVAGTAAGAVAGADAVLTMLWDGGSVAEVMTGALPAAPDGVLWAQASTVSLHDAGVRLPALAGRYGARYVDAPVLGTRQPAEEGRLVVLAAAPGPLRDPATSLFGAIAARTVWVSEQPGDGTRLKLAVNSWVGTIVAATAQAIALAQGLGLDPQLLLDTVRGGADQTWLSPCRSPWTSTRGTGRARTSSAQSHQRSTARCCPGVTRRPNRSRSAAVVTSGYQAGTGPTAASARRRVWSLCSTARNRASCLPAWSRSIPSTVSNKLVPGTRLVTRISGLVPAATTTGRYGTAGSSASVSKMVIWCRMNRAAACDHANFTTKSSPRAALDMWNTGSSWPARPGIVTGSPANAGATTRSASAMAAGDGPGSQLTNRNSPAASMSQPAR